MILTVTEAPELHADILDVNVSPGIHVVEQVPARMIGIVIDHDIVAVPQPVVDVPELKRRDAEVEAAEPEPRRATARQRRRPRTPALSFGLRRRGSPPGAAPPNR